MLSPLLRSRQGFSIIEVLIASIVFALWFGGAYYLIDASYDASQRGREEIVLANLAREQIELIKNLRDANWATSQSWSGATQAWLKNPLINGLQIGGYYTIELSGAVLDIRPIAPLTSEALIMEDINSSTSTTRLCLTPESTYTHLCDATTRATPFHSYFVVSPVMIASSVAGTVIPLEKALRIESVWFSRLRPLQPYVMSTLITDWKR